MAIINNNLGKFFGPSQIFMGYVFIVCGLITVTYSLYALLFIIPGLFMAFTYTGTIIDTDGKRIRPYTSLFGFIRTGKWIEINKFTRFEIQKATRRYTSYSRGSVRFDMNISDINLLLIYKDGAGKVILNRFKNFEEARREMETLSGTLISPEEIVSQ
jgi:hypothetical protein